VDKQEITTALKDVRKEFLQAIEGLSEESMQQPGVIANWSIKDVIAHIALWESEMVKLLWEAKMGATPSTVHFKKPFDQLSVDSLNEQWYQENKDRPLDRILADFEGVRKQSLRRVEAFSNEDLTDPRRYHWLKDSPLWKWIASDSFEHENEHLGEITAWRQLKGI
jgi:hypothetical protein